ncbi:MAG: YfhO family protein [Chloroflexi bacterium]|nr:YfhO family protein [Chloroflexota bacterium]
MEKQRDSTRWKAAFVALALVAIVPFVLQWRLVFAAPVDARYLCCDFNDYHYPAYLTGRQWFRTGHFSQWDPFAHLGGAPVASDPMRGLLYPPNWAVFGLGSLLPTDDAYVRLIYASLLAHVALAGMATALLARSLAGLRWPYAAFAGVVFGASVWVESEVAGPPHTVAFSLTPIALYAWHRFLVSGRKRWAAAAALAVGLALLGGYQFVPLYITLPAMALLLVFHDWPIRDRLPVVARHGLWLGAIAALGLDLSAVQLLPGYIGYSSSYRPSIVSLDWSSEYLFSFEALYQLVIPTLYAGIARPSGMAYGGQYLGLLPLLLIFVYALWPSVRMRALRPAVALLSLGFLLSLGKQTLLQQLAYRTIPTMGLWRSVNYYFVLVVVFGAVLSAGALQSLADRDQDARRVAYWARVVAAVALIAVGVALLVATAQRGVAVASGNAGAATAYLALARTLGAFAVVLALTFVALLWFLRAPSATRAALLAAVLVLDGGIYLASSALVNGPVSPATLYGPNVVTERLLAARQDPLERVVFDNRLVYRHSTGDLDIFAHRSYTALRPAYADALLNTMTGSPAALQAFGFRWVLSTYPQQESPGAQVLRDTIPVPQTTPPTIWLQDPYPEWQPARGSLYLYELPGAFPRAFAVPRVIGLRDRSPEVAVAVLRQVDPRTTAVVALDDVVPEARDAAFADVSFATADVKVVQYERDYVRMRVEAPGPAFVVMTDAYHPGWALKIDGQDAPLLRTDAHFRGFVVPSGQHDIEMTFKDAAFLWGAVVSGLSFAAILLLWASDHVRGRVRETLREWTANILRRRPASP